MLNEEKNIFENEDFGKMLNESMGNIKSFQGQILKGLVVGLEDDYVIVDVGLKSEGRIPLSEFKKSDGSLEELNINKELEVYIDFYEDVTGLVKISREKAKRAETWKELEDMYKRGEHIVGEVVKRIKGGFIVAIKDLSAFLPGSQLDTRPIRNIGSLVGTTQTLEIIKMENNKHNIIVSRKAVLEKTKGSSVDEIAKFEEGSIVEGVVKNITGYGIFIDLGNIDGLLHVTDISWSRINHPSEVMKIGQSVKVKVIKVDANNNRISLGLKQLTEDPWESIESEYPVGGKYPAKVINIVDYGVFVELKKGIEGLVHISGLKYDKSKELSDTFAIGDNIEVILLEIDVKKRRLILGTSDTEENDNADEIPSQYSVGSEHELEILEKSNDSFILKIPELSGFNGVLRFDNLSWDRAIDEVVEDYKVGDKVKAKLLFIDKNHNSIEFGVKQIISGEVSDYSVGNE